MRDELAGRATPSCSAAELAVLTTFADLCELSRNRPARRGGRRRAGAQPARVLPRLPALPRRRPGAPARAVPAKLARVARHYGVDGLDRTADLEEAVFRVFLSQQRTGGHLPVVTTLLQGWLGDEAPADGVASAPARCWTVWSSPPSCASRRSATWPAAPGSAGSRRRSWRPPGRRRTPPSGTSSGTCRNTRTPPTTRTGSRPSSPAPSRSSGSSPSGSPAECRPPSRWSRCSRAGTTRARARATAVDAGALGGRPLVVGDYAIHGGRTRMVATVAASTSCPLWTGRSASSSPRPGPATTWWWTSTCRGRAPRPARTSRA